MVKIVTHNGNFHTDDIFAVATLTLVYPDAEVVRSRDTEVIESADIVVDVGQIYDVVKKRFDHHQPEGAGKRKNNIPYASFGLVWKEYGEQLTGSEEAANLIDERLAMPIDASDNGFELYTSIVEGVKPYSIGSYFKSFVGTDETMDELDEIFNKVMIIARETLAREIDKAKSDFNDYQEARRIYSESQDKQIIVLSDYISWHRALVPTDALYVVAPRTDGKWQVRAVPTKVRGFELKKPLPKSWAGLKDEELAKVSGVPDAFFCHKDLFLAGADSQEGAIALAKGALNE